MGRRKKEELASDQWAAYEYRLDGWSYQQIADHMGVSISMAHRYVQSAFKSLANDVPENLEDIKRAELQRCDILLKGLSPMAHVGNVGAVTAYLKVMDHRAKLMGLYAPAKSEYEIKDWRTEAIRAIQDGNLGYDDLIDLFDEDTARQLLTQAEVDI